MHEVHYVCVVESNFYTFGICKVAQLTHLDWCKEGVEHSSSKLKLLQLLSASPPCGRMVNRSPTYVSPWSTLREQCCTHAVVADSCCSTSIFLGVVHLTNLKSVKASKSGWWCDLNESLFETCSTGYKPHDVSLILVPSATDSKRSEAHTWKKLTRKHHRSSSSLG